MNKANAERLKKWYNITIVCINDTHIQIEIVLSKEV